MAIYYKPEISYKLEDLPATEMVENVTEPEYTVPVEEIKDYDEELNLNIDFIIHLCEEKLKESEGFEEYKELAKEKYYCLNPLDSSDREVINEFERKHQSTTRKGIDSNIEDYAEDTESRSLLDNSLAIASHLYPRALSLKSDIEMDLEEDEKLEETTNSYSLNLLEDTVDKVENYSSFLKDTEIPDLDFAIAHEDYDPVDSDHREKIDKINKSLDDLDRVENKLKEEYARSIDLGNKDRARELQKALDNIKKDKNKIANEVSYISSTTYTLFQKSEETDSYIQKMGYLLLASPLDKLDQTVCCLIKVLLKQLDIEDELDSLEITIGKDFYDRFHKNVPLRELIDTVSALRILLNISLYASGDKLNKFINKINNALNAPVREALNKLLDILFKVRRKITDKIENNFNHILYSDPENPENILDCIHFEAFADFIFDSLEDLDEEIKDRVVDLYKLIHEKTESYIEDIIELSRNDKIRQVERILAKLEDALNNFDEFIKNMSKEQTLTAKDGLENIITEFLHEIGLDTTYNSDTGQFETIDLSDCLDTGEDTNNYLHYLPDREDDVGEINLRDDKNYKDFIKDNPDGIDLDCETVGEAEDYRQDVNIDEYVDS